jgi:ferritin-like metal-binding protein YciE
LSGLDISIRTFLVGFLARRRGLTRSGGWRISSTGSTPRRGRHEGRPANPLFDVTVEATIGEVADDELGTHLDRYLKDAHALEQQAEQLLTIAPKLADGGGLAGIFAAHLSQTRDHLQFVGDRLSARGTGPSRVKDLALRTGALNVAIFFAAQPDTTVKLSGFAYAFENLEVAVYELLRRVAERASDPETATMAAEISAEEIATAAAIGGTWERTIDERMAKMSGASSPADAS